MIIISLPTIVKAEGLKEITNDLEIRYKWYKEVLKGDYYLLKDKKEGYIVDEDKIKFGPVSDWNEENCNLPNNYYSKELNFKRTYKKVDNVRFVKLEFFNFNNNVKIYHNNEEIDYRIISVDTSTMIINLIKEYMADNLVFYIQDATNYRITLYKDEYLSNVILSKYIENEDLLIPDKTWIHKHTYYINYYTTDILKETDLTKKISQVQICRVREIYAYKYKITKEYYDDNYHLNVDGYIKDKNDYKIFYEEKPITNIVEITKEKIVKEPKIEYIYIPSENEIEKFDSSEKIECIPEIKKELKTEIKTIQKEIYKVPKKIYIIITILLLVIILLIIKLCKKYVD